MQPSTAVVFPFAPKNIYLSARNFESTHWGKMSMFRVIRSDEGNFNLIKFNSMEGTLASDTFCTEVLDE